MADGPMDANRQNVFDALRATYWKAAHREICTMILFFSDVLDHGRKIENFLITEFADLECENFKKMFDLWLGGQRQGWEGFDTRPLYEETIRRARERISADGLSGTKLLMRKLHILARRLLQSSSFLDIDVFYEPAVPLLPSLGQALPLLERTKIPATDSTFRCTALRAMRCAVCSLLIRTEDYFECGKGCFDGKSDSLKVDLIDDRGSKIQQDLPAGSLRSSPLRLCLTCKIQDIDLGTCARDHLRRRSTSGGKDEGSGVSRERLVRQASGSSTARRTLKDILLPRRAEQNFQKRLSRDEDEEYLQKTKAHHITRLFASVLKADSLHSRVPPRLFGLPFDTMIASPMSAFEILSGTIGGIRSKVTPAGTYHLSLKFGPVLIESGVNKVKVGAKEYTTRRGILVSPRFSPAILADKKSAAVLLFEPPDRLELNRQIIGFGTCCNLYMEKDKDGQYKRRRVELVRRPIEEKGGLVSLKNVYGAAFSGYPDSKRQGEEATVEALVEQALSFHQAPYRSKDTNIQRQALSEAADHVLTSLQYAIEDEVNKYLNRLVEVFLHPDCKITWSALSNNCQQLVDRLLQGKDFEYFFPRIPKQPETAGDRSSDVDWPRYLMSFSDRIGGDMVSLQQPNSILTEYFSRTRGGGDLVEFLSTRTQGSDTPRKYAALLLEQGALVNTDDYATASNALWEMPRDTLSILQFHLCRDRLRYVSSNGRVLDQREWMENRLLLLLLSDLVGSLSGGLGASLLSLFTTNPGLVSRIVLPKARVLGTARVGERVRILRLPGKQIVYFIANESDDVVEKLFEASEYEVDKIVEVIRKYLRQHLSLATKLSFEYAITTAIDILVGNLQERNSQAKGGFKSITRVSGNGLLSMTIRQAFRLYKIQQRDGWVSLDLGGFIIVLQLFRKSKTIRESRAKLLPKLIQDSGRTRTNNRI